MIPKYLYHYTSVSAVKAILKNKTIRFTRLDSVNDPYEACFILRDESSELNTLQQKFIYCSSWTEEEDSLILWSVYAKDNGVRIKMKANMFSENMNWKEIEDGFIPIADISQQDKKILMVKDREEVKIKTIEGPIKIKYEDDFQYMHEPVSVYKGTDSQTGKDIDLTNINVEELGIKKVKYWESEREWRYIINPFKATVATEYTFDKIDFSDMIISPPYIDVPYISCIEDIKLSPFIKKAWHDSFLNWMDENCVNIPVMKSDIKMR